MKIRLTLYGLALAVIIACVAKAEDPHSMHHEWYKDLQSNQGGSCCNGEDCRPTHVTSKDGKAYIKIHGKWCEADEKLVLRGKTAPDMGWHVCAPTTPIPGAECLHFCIVEGMGL